VVGRWTSIIWTAANFSSALRAVSPGARAWSRGALITNIRNVKSAHSFLVMMEDRADRQVALQGLEGLLDGALSVRLVVAYI